MCSWCVLDRWIDRQKRSEKGMVVMWGGRGVDGVRRSVEEKGKSH